MTEQKVRQVAMSQDPLREDLSDVQDDELQALFKAAERIQELGFLMKCKVVATFRSNHKWGSEDSWVDRARELFSRSRPTLYAYANMWRLYLASDERSRHGIGLLADSKFLTQFIGRKTVEDGKAALEAAVEYKDEFGELPTVAAVRERLGEGASPSKRKYGLPLNFREFRHEPINELGVVFLFGMVARELDFLVEAVASEFPDCVAKRKTKGGFYETVNIEFEFKASNFREHKHSPEHCDILVCWEDDWPDCPLEVIELKHAIEHLPASYSH